MDYVFETRMRVRDYECDLQGIVNNAVYQNYLEHARHEFLHEVGIDFAQLPLLPASSWATNSRLSRAMNLSSKSACTSRGASASSLIRPSIARPTTSSSSKPKSLAS